MIKGKLKPYIKLASILSIVGGFAGYSVCTYAEDNHDEKQIKSIVEESKTKRIMEEDDFIGDDIFAVQVAEDRYIAEQKRIAEEKRKAEEEEAKRVAEAKAKEQAAKAQAQTQSSGVAYTGRYRLSLSNDSDETMVNRINACFEGYPVAGLGQYIVNVGKQYNLDPYFIAAVIWEESGRGISPLAQNNHNLFGRKAISGWKYSESFEQDIADFGPYIVDVYFACGLYSIESIATKYCPNQGWDRKIINHIRSLMS